MASPVVESTVITLDSARSTTTLTMTMPSSIASGDLLLMFVGQEGPSSTLSPPSGWTSLAVEGPTNDLTGLWCYKYSSGSESSTVNVTVEDTYASGSIYRISGAEDPSTTAPEINKAGYLSTSSDSVPSATISGGSKDYLFVCQFVGHHGFRSVSTFSTGYTGTNGGGGESARVFHQYKAATTSTETPGNLTWTANPNTVIGTITVYPYTGGGGSTPKGPFSNPFMGAFGGPI